MDPEYPQLYKAADHFSIVAQRRYYQVIEAKLVMLLGLAVISAFSWVSASSLRTATFLIVATILIAGLLLEAVASKQRFDRAWFAARSLAESTKVQSWFYMMRISPYDDNSKANSAFLSTLEGIKLQESNISPEVLAGSAKGNQITDAMTKIRSGSSIERLELYRRERIAEQKNWYADRSLKNAHREAVWNLLSIGLQAAAAVLTLILIVSGGFSVQVDGFSIPVNPVGMLTTASAAILTWAQAKRVGELSRSYALIAGELSTLDELSRNVKDDETLNKLVVDVERTISREHTLWVIRRSEQSRHPPTT